METRQIIYPTERLLANPRLFIAIANMFDGPDWEVFQDAFYELVESQFLEDEETEPDMLICKECCFRQSPDDPDVYQVILSNGDAIELNPTPENGFSAVRTEDDLAITSAIYGRLVQALEDAQPQLSGDIALVNVPNHANGFLRHESGDSFRGEFHLKSDPDTKFNFIIDVVDLENDDLRARITPQ